MAEQVWADVLSAACTCRWRKSRPGWLLVARDTSCPLRHGGGHD